MRIALATDHAGFALKEALKVFLAAEGHEVVDFGANEMNQDDDYPDFVRPAAEAVAKGEVERGVILGSSGEGESIVANRVPGARACVFYGHRDPLPKTAKAGAQRGILESSREDNDSNVLAIGASFVSVDEAKEALKIWLSTPFSGDDRHVRRIGKIDA